MNPLQSYVNDVSFPATQHIYSRRAHYVHLTYRRSFEHLPIIKPSSYITVGFMVCDK
jgi:hypothetical protein